MKLSVLTLCVLGACSMSAYASTTNIVNAQSQFLMSYNGNKDDSSNVRKNGSYCETKTLNIVHNIEQDKTYQGVGIKKIDKVTGTYQTVCVKDGKQTFAPPYTQTYINDITYEYQCTRRSEEKFEHYASDCVTSKNIYSNGIIGNAVRLMRFRGEENSDSSYSNLPSYDRVVNSCETMTLESRGTPVDVCPLPIGSTGTPDVIRIEDISNQNSVATIRITDNKNTTDATINYKSTKINLSKEWLDQLERVTIKNAKAKDWMFVTLKNPVGVNAGAETILQMPYVGNSAEPPQLHLCNNLERFNWGSHSVSGSKVQDLSLIFNSIAGYKNISTTGNLSISQYPCEVTADRTGDNLAKSRFPIVQGRHWEMNGGALRATWDEPERVEGSHGFLLNGLVGQFIKDFQTRQCNHNAYQATEDKEICKLNNALHPFIYNAQNQRKGIEGSGVFGVYLKQDILPLLQQGFNNIEILTIGRDKNMELTLEFTFKGNKPSISKKIEDEKNNCYGRGHDASCNEQNNENNNNTGGNNPMVPPDELDPNKNYSGWIEYHCSSKYTNQNKKIIGNCKDNLEQTSRRNINELKEVLLNDKTTYGSSKNTGVYGKEHNDIVNACNNLLESYEERLGSSIKTQESLQQLNCRNTAHQKYRSCLENHSNNYEDIQKCFKKEENNINNYIPDPLFEPLIDEQCGKLSNGQLQCKEKFTNDLIKTGYKCPEGDTTVCISEIMKNIQKFKPDNYYENKQTDYDGWISYTCNEDLNCVREFKASKKESGDLKYDLLNYRTTFEGLLSRDYDEIKKICDQRGGELKTKSGTFLKSICLNNIVTKHQSCLENNKTDLPQIQICFNKEKKNIHFWYSERYFLEVVQEQCKVRGANNAHFLTQCVNKYNAQFIQNFMNQSKGVDIEGYILPISAYEFNLKLEVDKFVPEENNYGNTSSQVKQSCQKRFEQYDEGPNKTRAINGCISFVNRKYNECKERGNAASCNARIQGYVNSYRH